MMIYEKNLAIINLILLITILILLYYQNNRIDNLLEVLKAYETSYRALDSRFFLLEFQSRSFWLWFF